MKHQLSWLPKAAILVYNELRRLHCLSGFAAAQEVFTRLFSPGSLRRALVLLAFSLLACTWFAASAAFAQRSGAHVGGGVRVVPPRVVAPRPFPRQFIYPIRPLSPLVLPYYGFWPGSYFGVEPAFGLGPLWGQGCGLSAAYLCNPYPTYYLYGSGERDLAQLYLTDGTVYSVTDYWLVDNQLHFTTIEENSDKVVEHTIDLNQLDLQKTIDVNTRRGFHFVLRNEPIDQYLRDHPEIGAPGSPSNALPPGPLTPQIPAPTQPQP